MPGDGVDVATRDGPGECGCRRRASRRSRSTARTSGSSASGGTPAASATRAAWPSSATRWFDAIVAAAWYAARRSASAPGTAAAERHREALDDGGTVDRAPRAGQPGDAEVGRRQRLQRMERTDLDVGPGDAQLVELVERACAGEVDDERAGAQGRRQCGGGVGDLRRRAWRSRTRSASRPASATVAAGAPSRVAAAASRAASGARPATATGVHPRATSASRQRGTGAAGPHEGERPLRSTVTCTST